MAYTQYNDAQPAGSDLASAFPTEINANTNALRDMVEFGQVQGIDLSVSGGTAEEPTYYVFTKHGGAVLGRATMTWSSGKATGIKWEKWNGASYDAVLSADQVLTYDGSGNLTATTNAGGLMSLLWYVIAKAKSTLSTLTSHAALTGSAAHGLGTISTQAAASVGLTGGTINGTTVGLSTAAEGLFTRVSEQFNSGGIYNPTSNASVAVDWTKGGSIITNNGTNVLTFSNVPSGRIATHAIYCSNFNATTFPAAVDWGLGGKPSIAAAVLCDMISLNGGTNVMGAIVWRAA